eukprot:1834143-Rhodomonas_salina.1
MQMSSNDLGLCTNKQEPRLPSALVRLRGWCRVAGLPAFLCAKSARARLEMSQYYQSASHVMTRSGYIISPQLGAARWSSCGCGLVCDGGEGDAWHWKLCGCRSEDHGSGWRILDRGGVTDAYSPCQMRQPSKE